MSNEGPKRSDFIEAGKVPPCDEKCADVHGDQAFTEDELELFRLRGAGLCALCLGVGMHLQDGHLLICGRCRGSGRRTKTEAPPEGGDHG